MLWQEGGGTGAECVPQCRAGCGSMSRLLVPERCQDSRASLTILQLTPWESSTALGGARGLGVPALILGCHFPFELVETLGEPSTDPASLETAQTSASPRLQPRSEPWMGSVIYVFMLF